MQTRADRHGRVESCVALHPGCAPRNAGAVASSGWVGEVTTTTQGLITLSSFQLSLHTANQHLSTAINPFGGPMLLEE